MNYTYYNLEFICLLPSLVFLAYYFWTVKNSSNALLVFYLTCFLAFFQLPIILYQFGITHPHDDLIFWNINLNRINTEWIFWPLNKPYGHTTTYISVFSLSHLFATIYISVFSLSMFGAYHLFGTTAQNISQRINNNITTRLTNFTVADGILSSLMISFLITAITLNPFGQLRGAFDAGAMTQIFKALGSLIFMVPALVIFTPMNNRKKYLLILFFFLVTALLGRRELLGALAAVLFIKFWSDWQVKNGILKALFMASATILFSITIHTLGLFRSFFYFFIEEGKRDAGKTFEHMYSILSAHLGDPTHFLLPFIKRMNYFAPFKKLNELGLIVDGGFNYQIIPNAIGVEFLQNAYGLIPRALWDEKPTIGYDTRHIAEIFDWVASNDTTTAVGIGYIAEAAIALGLYGFLWAAFLGIILRLICEMFNVFYNSGNVIFAAIITFMFGHFAMQVSHIAFLPTMVIFTLAVLVFILTSIFIRLLRTNMRQYF